MSCTFLSTVSHPYSVFPLFFLLLSLLLLPSPARSAILLHHFPSPSPLVQRALPNSKLPLQYVKLLPRQTARWGEISEQWSGHRLLFVTCHREAWRLEHVDLRVVEMADWYLISASGEAMVMMDVYLMGLLFHSWRRHCWHYWFYNILSGFIRAEKITNFVVFLNIPGYKQSSSPLGMKCECSCT